MGRWGETGDALVRAVAGGMLFGIPLLYTMEVWWIGTQSEPPAILAALLVSAVPVYALNRTAGFRRTADVRTVDALADTAEALAVSLLSATLVLFVLREISLDAGALEAVGKVVYEAVPFAVGVSLARHYLQGSREGGDDEGGDEEKGEDSDEGGRVHQTAADLGAAAIGALFLAFNIAPTDEVPMLTAPISGLWLVAVIVLSLVLTYGIVFEAGFRGSEQRRSHEGPLQTPLAETLAAYLIALIVCALLLLFFQRLDFATPLSEWVSQVIVLGLPAAIGAAAGRLAV